MVLSCIELYRIRYNKSEFSRIILTRMQLNSVLELYVSSILSLQSSGRGCRERVSCEMVGAISSIEYRGGERQTFSTP